MNKFDKISIMHSQQDDIEFISFMESMKSFGNMYMRHVSSDTSDDFRLSIKGVREGSIILDLMPVLASASNISEIVANAVNFAKNYKAITDYLLTGENRPENFTERDCKDIGAIYAPAANSVKGNTNIHFHGDVNISINTSRVEAAAIKNSAIEEIERLKEPDTEIQREVTMYWHTAKNIEKEAAADRGIIEKIDDKPKKILFGDRSEIKASMIGGNQNPFERGFLVDVEVLTLRGKIQAYKVLRLHEDFSIE